MSCGIPCVVTDAGDSSLLVGEAGKVVCVKDSKALSEAWVEMLCLKEDKFEALSVSARIRVVNKFSVKVLLDNTVQVLIQEHN